MLLRKSVAAIPRTGFTLHNSIPGVLSAFALSEIEQMKAAGHDIQAAVASKTDEPNWARICMDNLIVGTEETRIISCFENGRLVEISYGSKTQHLTRLHKKTGIPFEQMAFFDNEYGNIRSVSSLGVACYYTPRGMTKQDWEKAKEDFGVTFDAVSGDSASEDNT